MNMMCLCILMKRMTGMRKFTVWLNRNIKYCLEYSPSPQVLLLHYVLHTVKLSGECEHVTYLVWSFQAVTSVRCPTSDRVKKDFTTFTNLSILSSTTDTCVSSPKVSLFVWFYWLTCNAMWVYVMAVPSGRPSVRPAGVVKTLTLAISRLI